MPLLEIKNLKTFFKTKKGIVKAVNDVSYSLEAGKTIGIVGESGSGKSVSAMSILRLLDGNGYIANGVCHRKFNRVVATLGRDVEGCLLYVDDAIGIIWWGGVVSAWVALTTEKQTCKR